MAQEGGDRNPEKEGEGDGGGGSCTVSGVQTQLASCL